MKRDFSHFLVSSNVFFLAPLLLSLYLHMYLHALSVCICIVGSTLYHRSGELKMDLTDRYSAIQLICVNMVLLALGGFQYSLVLIITAVVVLAFCFKWLAQHKNYSVWHSMWHLTSVLITLASILSYKSLF